MLNFFTEKEQLFIDLILEIGKDSLNVVPTNESYDDITEEDLYRISLIMEFFLDNYKTPSLNQTARNVLLNYDVNEALYITVIDALLSEGYLTNKIASGIIKTTNPIKSRNITKLYNKTEKYLQKGQNTLAKNKLPTSNFIGNAYRKGKAEKYLQKAMTLNQKHTDLTKEIDTKKSALQNKLDNSLIGKGINAVESGVKGVINTGKAIVNAPKNLMTKLATATGKAMAF